MPTLLLAPELLPPCTTLRTGVPAALDGDPDIGVGLAPLGAFGLGMRFPSNGEISLGEGIFTEVFIFALRTISNSGPRYRGTLDREKLSMVRPWVRLA